MYSVPNQESEFWVQLFSYKATALDSYLFNSYVSGTSQVQIATLSTRAGGEDLQSTEEGTGQEDPGS